MMTPHSQQDEMHRRFSLVDRYNQLSGRSSHRGGRDLAEENPRWESDIQFNKSVSLLERILSEAPSNKKYALIPWKVFDKMDHKAYASKAMIELHRENGYNIVPAARHKKANLVSDRVYAQLDNHANLDKRNHQDETLHDQAIIIGENIIMERDLEEHNRYVGFIEEQNNRQYKEIGPNGTKNNPRVNDRYMKMQYFKTDDEMSYDDPNEYLYDRSQLNQFGY